MSDIELDSREYLGAYCDDAHNRRWIFTDDPVALMEQDSNDVILVDDMEALRQALLDRYGLVDDPDFNQIDVQSYSDNWHGKTGRRIYVYRAPSLRFDKSIQATWEDSEDERFRKARSRIDLARTVARRHPGLHLGVDYVDPEVVRESGMLPTGKRQHMWVDEEFIYKHSSIVYDPVSASKLFKRIRTREQNTEQETSKNRAKGILRSSELISLIKGLKEILVATPLGLDRTRVRVEKSPRKNLSHLIQAAALVARLIVVAGSTMTIDTSQSEDLVVGLKKKHDMKATHVNKETFEQVRQIVAELKNPENDPELEEFMHAMRALLALDLMPTT